MDEYMRLYCSLGLAAITLVSIGFLAVIIIDYELRKEEREKNRHDVNKEGLCKK